MHMSLYRYACAVTLPRLRLPSSFNIMDKSRQVAARFKEIDSVVSSLKEELKAYEREYYEKVLVAFVEQKNKRLQEQVRKAIEELETIERSPGPNTIALLSSPNVTTVNNLPVTQQAQEKSTSASPPVEKQSNENNKKRKLDGKEKNEGKSKGAKAPASASEEGPVDVGRLDMRVGKIIDIKKHPDADSLYVEQVDIGKPTPITVVSGLVKHVPIEEMQNRLVVILCNLKPAKMRGITSEGMVMCASSPDKVEVLRPPPSCVPGDLITVPGFQRAPDAVLNPKKKIFETVAPDLKTDQELCASYKGAKWMVEGKGVITADSLVGVSIK